MKKTGMALLLLLTGCTSLSPHVEYLYESSQGPVYEAYCNGTANTIGKCYQLAANTCGSDFKILNKSEKYQKASRSKNASNEDYTEYFNKYPTVKRNLIFYCLK